MFDEEQMNLNHAKQCQCCTFERVICLQENRCLLLVQEQLREVINELGEDI